MALSTFKSTSKRGTTPTSSSSSSSKQEKFPIRRSRSVSALSRTHGPVPSSSSSSTTSNLSISDDLFLNKRDNPLFCCSSSSCSSSSSSPATQTSAVDSSSKGGCTGRGRSVSRASGGVTRPPGDGRSEKTAARSLSRTDTGRRRLRSVSREHLRNLETDMENRYKSTSSLESKEDGNSCTSNGHRKTVFTATEFDAKRQARNLQTWTSRHPVSESWDASSTCSQYKNWGDGISTSSFSEADDPISSETDNSSGAIYETVRSEVRRVVSEIRDDLENAIWRKNPSILPGASNGDIAPEFANTNELISDVEREFVTKLEQTREHARKLRADLAVEEQREEELNRILKEIMLSTRNSDFRNSHPKRKGSIERRRMSRRLAEEALNYFDECVSITTFDSSDFSSFDDPQISLVDGIPSISSTGFIPNEGSTHAFSDFPNVHSNHHEEFDNQTQCSVSVAGTDLAANSSCGSQAGSLMHANSSRDDLLGHDTLRSEKLELSPSVDRTEAVGAHDIRKYIKKFEKPRKEILEHVNVKSSYCSDGYELSANAESFIFDSLVLRNRMESGGMLLCDIRIF